ncbi:MAG: tRNA uridine-5-carboxymethylaminomethyl(34) synthesis GTPase MnmE [Candidatus Marinimicrobia bacterium]|nr:tRNA uridine-5-carboxymethylaminomethyl(34) synthesis GTPase MnmE [Candidatus Neomarinimicrobiota bacterium]
MNAGDTIVAPATPFGYSGIAVIRISGPKAFPILTKLSGEKHFANRLATLLWLKDRRGYLIDQCLATIFNGPNSYTGEDVVEISSHGNPSIIENIVDAACDCGSRLAEAGEFTRRAFFNGKMDLLQAEAVASLIHSKSVENTRCQQKILQGSLSNLLNNLRGKMINILSGLEYQLDLSEEDLTGEENKTISKKINTILSIIKTFKETFYLGRLINRGATVVIAGEPNVGKSTLLNCLAGSNRAIVSDVPGTTRDTIEVELLMGGAPVLFVDTAGIRNAENSVEKAGVSRALKSVENADLIISLIDKPGSKHLIQTKKPLLKVFNKCDLYAEKQNDSNIIHISSKENTGIGVLKKAVSRALGINKISTEAMYLSTSRQYHAINRCATALNDAQGLASCKNIDIELLAFELRIALDAVDSILGKTSPDDILNHVFGTLCVGK